MFLVTFYQRSSIVKSIFHCHLSGVFMLNKKVVEGVKVIEFENVGQGHQITVCDCRVWGEKLLYAR